MSIERAACVIDAIIADMDAPVDCVTRARWAGLVAERLGEPTLAEACAVVERELRARGVWHVEVETEPGSVSVEASGGLTHDGEGPDLATALADALGKIDGAALLGSRGGA